MFKSIFGTVSHDPGTVLTVFVIHSAELLLISTDYSPRLLTNLLNGVGGVVLGCVTKHTHNPPSISDHFTHVTFWPAEYRTMRVSAILLTLLTSYSRVT
jgi:hypothetical protein